MSTEEEEQQFAARLKSVRLHLGKTQPEMDELLGLGKKSWQKYESGGSAPGKGVFDALAKQGVNINWLLSNDGPMMLEGGAREAHSEMVSSLLLQEPGAIERRGARIAEQSASYGLKHVQSDATVEGMIDTLGHRPPAVVAYALKQALASNDLTLAGCLAILNAMKTAAAEESRKKGVDHG